LFFRKTVGFAPEGHAQTYECLGMGEALDVGEHADASQLAGDVRPPLVDARVVKLDADDRGVSLAVVGRFDHFTDDVNGARRGTGLVLGRVREVDMVAGLEVEHFRVSGFFSVFCSPLRQPNYSSYATEVKEKNKKKNFPVGTAFGTETPA
jgi:hypothetical protein